MTDAPPPDQVPPPPPAPPARAFTQGTGLVFQFVGVILFLVMFFTCCGSSLLSKDWATRSELTHIGWGTASTETHQPAYSAQRALTISIFAGVVLGMALAGAGLGMQAGSRVAAPGAVAVALIGAIFWLVQTIFAASAARSVLFTIVAAGLTILFAILLIFAINAFMEMRKNPPPEGHDLLPPGYKIPYSHYHDDPPEVRLAAELEQRRARLAVQQKELEALEEKIKRSVEDDPHREQQS